MNFVSRNESRVVIRQVPFLLLFVAAFFSLPFLAFSLFHLVRGTDADGTIFCFIFGLFMLWLLLEFVATRERINIDLKGRTLIRTVRGVFRKQEQRIDLNDIKTIGLEIKQDPRARRRQYLFMYGSKENYLVNSPSKAYLNHSRLGRVLSEVTHIPFSV